ncbi:spermidine hydroxycinnamoyl transferase-like [Vigna unguiculata]|uniref:spermidine hydroxycinnamoyl transferase-like n=1 Tax=Vigna unguiculata TaxID=3917 RepID=UPI0010167E03|nr:spermidine hydroxycinnamoyl transferase-like [Vigna unguiculata]
MVAIVASYSVFPSKETPKGHLWLSDSDQVVRSGHTPTIYVYKAKHIDDTTKRLINSLAEILVHYYPLAGRLSLAESGRIEVDCNAKGVTFIEAETTKSLGDYGDFSPSESVKELVPKIDYTQPIEEIPLLLVQFTRFRGGEGFVVGVAFCHPLADGLAGTQFINLWAKVARGETLEPHELPYLDRTILKLQHSSASPCFDHPELKPLPLKLGSSDVNAEQSKKTSGVLLKLTPEQVQKLKKEANEEALEEGVREYSRFEAIAGHVWRCACKGRELDEKQPTVVRFNADIRSRLIPPLPRNYFGNALAATVSAECYVGEIVSKPLSYGAQKVREAIEKLSNEYIRSQLRIVLGEEQLDCIRGLFLGQGERMNVPFAGNPNLQITSWMSMAVYEADFGWGKPVFFGLAYVSAQDRAVILQSPDGDGSIIVSMHFQEPHLELFKKFFYQSL